MLFGQCPHGGGDKLKGASLKKCQTQLKVLKSELPACRDFWTSIPDVLSPHGASLDLAIAPEGLLKVIILERVDLDSLNEKLDTVMIRWDQLIDMGRGGMRSAVGSIVFNQWLGMANFCTFE